MWYFYLFINVWPAEWPFVFYFFDSRLKDVFVWCSFDLTKWDIRKNLGQYFFYLKVSWQNTVIILNVCERKVCSSNILVLFDFFWNIFILKFVWWHFHWCHIIIFFNNRRYFCENGVFLQKIKQNMFLALLLLLTEPLQDPKLDVGIRNRSVLHQQGAGQFRRTTNEENVKIVCEALFQSPGKSVRTASTVINAAFYRS